MSGRPKDMPRDMWEAATGAQNGHARRVPATFTGNDLRDKEFPPVRWAVEGILPAGVTLFGGREKMGKSFLAFGLCIAVATGGHALGKIPVQQGEALYISMEDPERRLQKRLRRLAREETDLSALNYATEWEPADRGGVEDLDAWLAAHPDCRLVVADTLKRIRPRTSGRRNMYDEDYEAVQPFVKIAAEHNAAVVLIHHLNQQSEPHDPFDAFTGSTGLTAAAEGIMLLTRKRGDADAFLMADGKDIEEPQDLALSWDAATCAWTIQGDAATYRMHKERREIAELLEREDEPTGPKYVADALGKDYGTIQRTMHRMADDGQLQRAGYGKYVVSQGVSLTSLSSLTSTIGLSKTTQTDKTDPLAKLLDDPPEWLVRCLPECVRDPGRHLDSTTVALATAARGGGQPTDAEKSASRAALVAYIGSLNGAEGGAA